MVALIQTLVEKGGGNDASSPLALGTLCVCVCVCGYLQFTHYLTAVSICQQQGKLFGSSLLSLVQKEGGGEFVSRKTAQTFSWIRGGHLKQQTNHIALNSCQDFFLRFSFFFFPDMQVDLLRI